MNPAEFTSNLAAAVTRAGKRPGLAAGAGLAAVTAPLFFKNYQRGYAKTSLITWSLRPAATKIPRAYARWLRLPLWSIRSFWGALYQAGTALKFDRSDRLSESIKSEGSWSEFPGIPTSTWGFRYTCPDSDPGNCRSSIGTQGKKLYFHSRHTSASYGSDMLSNRVNTLTPVHQKKMKML